MQPIQVQQLAEVQARSTSYYRHRLKREQLCNYYRFQVHLHLQQRFIIKTRKRTHMGLTTCTERFTLRTFT